MPYLSLYSTFDVFVTLTAMEQQPKLLPSPIAQALSLAWELGYTITVPLVVLALGGRLLDRAWGTSPWLFVAGIVLSIAISTWLVYRKSVAILRASEGATPPSQVASPTPRQPELPKV